MNNIQLMPFKKFVQSHLRLIYYDNKKRINGTFKELDTGKIIKGDNFDANIIGKGTAEETYRAYLKWNNYIKNDFESDREYVFAEWVKEEIV